MSPIVDFGIVYQGSVRISLWTIRALTAFLRLLVYVVHGLVPLDSLVYRFVDVRDWYDDRSIVEQIHPKRVSQVSI